MGRPKKLIKTTAKNIRLPTDLVQKVDLLLYDNLEERVPFAAWQTLLTNLLQQHLTAQVAKATNDRDHEFYPEYPE